MPGAASPGVAIFRAPPPNSWSEPYRIALSRSILVVSRSITLQVTETAQIMSMRSILVRLKQWLVHRQIPASNAPELKPFIEEFAPDDPVLNEIEEAILARRQSRKNPKSSAA